MVDLLPEVYNFIIQRNFFRKFCNFYFYFLEHVLLFY